VLLVTSLTHISGAVTSVQTFTFISQYYFKNLGFPYTVTGNSQFSKLRKVENLRKTTPPHVFKTEKGRKYEENDPPPITRRPLTGLLFRPSTVE